MKRDQKGTALYPCKTRSCKNNQGAGRIEMKHEMIKVGGLAVEHYIPEENKDPIPILFCHGTGSGSWIWSNFCKYFSSKGWDSYAINYRGHYLSDQLKNL